MKKVFAILLTAAMAISAAACGSGEKKDGSSATEASSVETTAASAADTTAAPAADAAELKEKLDKILADEEQQGIVYVTQNGSVIYESAKGKDENGKDLTVNSPMYVGSVSKQFCAACVMMLRDQGKLSVDDTLDKYFPEYAEGKKITIKNLLTMRSGILDMVNQGVVEGVTVDNTAEENAELIKKWIFEQPLQHVPDKTFAYSNSNFFLLGCIVEQLSGQTYPEFVRKNIFEPLGMTHSGNIDEVTDAPAWSEGLSQEKAKENPKGLTKGAGDIITNAPDMDKWLEGLSSGKVVSEESYREMTTDHNTDTGSAYGYGLFVDVLDGVGHPGAINNYFARDYINDKEGIRFLLADNTFNGATADADMVATELIKAIIGK